MFTVDKANWTGYSLDGEQNNTINDNFTLNGLPNGLHNLTVYANDTYGNMGASETISFTVAVAEPESFPVVLGVAVSFTVALVVACLLVYRKNNSEKQTVTPKQRENNS
jgi:mannitol-specific phosphotransferase system IIBC component